jgi:hypothetical protein
MQVLRNNLLIPYRIGDVPFAERLMCGMLRLPSEA